MDSKTNQNKTNLEQTSFSSDSQIEQIKELFTKSSVYEMYLECVISVLKNVQVLAWFTYGFNTN